MPYASIKKCCGNCVREWMWCWSEEVLLWTICTTKHLCFPRFFSFVVVFLRILYYYRRRYDCNMIDTKYYYKIQIVDLQRILAWVPFVACNNFNWIIARFHFASLMCNVHWVLYEIWATEQSVKRIVSNLSFTFSFLFESQTANWMLSRRKIQVFLCCSDWNCYTHEHKQNKNKCIQNMTYRNFVDIRTIFFESKWNLLLHKHIKYKQ